MNTNGTAGHPQGNPTGGAKGGLMANRSFRLSDLSTNARARVPHLASAIAGLRASNGGRTVAARADGVLVQVTVGPRGGVRQRIASQHAIVSTAYYGGRS